MGDETFFKILRAYFKKYKNSDAGSDDFIAIAKEVSGQDIDPLFDTWLEDKIMPDMPEYGLYKKDYAN